MDLFLGTVFSSATIAVKHQTGWVSSLMFLKQMLN